MLKDRIKYFLFWSAMWGAASYLTYFYIHHWAVIIPAWFLSGTIVGVIMARKFGKSAITKLELLDQQHVKFHFLWGNHAVCKISDIETLGMKEISEDIPKGKGQVKKTLFLVIANFKDLKGRNYWQKRLLIDTHRTKVDHTDLFKSVMQGDVEEVQKFVFVEGGGEEELKAKEELKKKERVRESSSLVRKSLRS